MARDAAQRRQRAWTARPAGPVRYGPAARLADRWAAARDARLGILDPELIDKVGTPWCEYLGRMARDCAEREWLAYQADCADQLIRLGAVTGRLRAARERLHTARQDLAAAPAEPPAEQLAEIRPGESRRGTDPAVARARRAREHARDRASLVGQVRQAHDQVADLETEAANLEARVQVRFQVAQTRARRVIEHVRRRGAAYLERLAGRHPSGAKLCAAWNPDWPEPPDWVYGDRSPHVSADGTGGGSDGAQSA